MGMALVIFDLLAGGNYPYSAPSVRFSRGRAFFPHCSPKWGRVFVEDVWQSAKGNMLLSELIVHIMHLCNFDHPRPRGPVYNEKAVEYWRDVLDYRPLTPALCYPVLPLRIEQKPDRAQEPMRTRNRPPEALQFKVVGT